MYMFVCACIHVYMHTHTHHLPYHFAMQALRPERPQTACTDFITRVLKVDSLSPSL